MITPPAPAPPKGFRPNMPLRVKLEAALIALGLKPEAVHFDHDPPLQIRVWRPDREDTDPPANDPRYIVPRPAAEHREKTARKDVPEIAKTKRLSQKQEEFRRRLLAKDAGQPRPKTSKWRRK